MERRLNKINYSIGEMIARPLAVCTLILSGTFLTPETHAIKLSTPPIVNSVSLDSPFQNGYLKPPVLIETVSEKAEKFHLTDLVISGIAGYYSREGCLGCSKDMTMSNGDPLDDTELTIAAPLEIALNASVLITNTANNEAVIAKVSDRGGFKALGRIADFTPAVKAVIGGDTDLMDVVITVLEPADSIQGNP